MAPKLSVMAICFALPLFAIKERAELVTTDRADLAAGGAVHIENSTGDLSITGWDQPSIEVITTRYTFGEERNSAAASEKLKRIEVVKMTAGNGELTIAMQRHERGVHVECRIMVPRNSRLTIHHHIGDVTITGVESDIDATNGAGDMLLQVRDLEDYAIDAKSRLGTVYSDTGNPRHSGLVGERLVAKRSAPAHHLMLRVGAGGISIQKVA